MRGVAQLPVHGVSMSYSLTDPHAPSRRGRQYFEMGGHRAIYRDGWKAVTYHHAGADYDDDRWELYYLAARHPDRVDDPCVAIGQRPLRLQDALVHQAFEPLPAQLVPPRVEPSPVSGDVLRVCVQRPVRCGVGQVQEQRGVGTLLVVLRDEPDDVLGDRVGVVEAVLTLIRQRLATHERMWLVEASRAVQGAVDLIEAAPGRPVVHRHDGEGDRATVRGERAHHVPELGKGAEARASVAAWRAAIAA